MRSLRTIAEDFNYDYDAVEGTLRLELQLPAGSYVTCLLQHFLLLDDMS